jgi:hypothetical protein
MLYAPSLAENLRNRSSKEPRACRQCKHGRSNAWVDARERPSETVRSHDPSIWLSWKESRVLWELRCNLDDVGRCALSRTSTLSAMLQLRRRCAVNMLDAVNAGRSRALRESRRGGELELCWWFELTMLASVALEWLLLLAWCAASGGI